jgi:UPF0755 protein
MAKSVSRKKKRKSVSNSYLKVRIVGGIMTCILLALFYYLSFYANVNIRAQSCYFFIPDGANTRSVYESLKSKSIPGSNLSLWMMLQFDHLNQPRKGLYQLEKGWGNLRLIHHLNNAPLKPYTSYQVPAFKARSNMIRNICTSTGVDFGTFYSLLRDSSYIQNLGNFTRESIYCIFIPGNYKVYKNCGAAGLMEAMNSEYMLFWNPERYELAQKMGYSTEELTILASIVYAETKNTDEMPVIAGLYLNRLKKNMRLEADPTLVFASGKLHARRVYKKDAYHKSKYNTYRNKGIPPGPVGPAPMAALEAVLHPAEHQYLYFCANDDLSGCHIFTETYEAHKKNADRYRKVLNKNKVH